MCVHGCGAGFFTKEARKDHHVNCIEKDQPEKNKQPGPKELEKIYQKLRDDSIRKADAENPEEWRKVKPRIMRELEALLLQQDDKGKLVKKFDAYDLTNSEYFCTYPVFPSMLTKLKQDFLHRRTSPNAR